MLPETGPSPEESISQTDNASETSDNVRFQYAGHNGDKDSDSSFKNEGGIIEDNGGPASPDQLKDLKENGIGSKVSEPPEQRPEAVDPETEEAPPMPTEAAMENPKPTPAPSPEPPGQIISDTEVPPPPSPTDQPVIEETVELPPLSPEVIAGAQAAVDASNEVPLPETLPSEHQPSLRERFTGNIRSIFGRRTKEDTTLISVAPPPPPKPEPPASEQSEPEQPVTPVETQGTPVTAPPPPPEPEQEHHQTVEDQLQERYSALEEGSDLKIGKTDYKVDKIETEQIGDEQIVRFRLAKPNGETLYRYDHEIKAELEKQIIEERKDAARESEKAAQEQAREESRKAKEAEKEARKTPLQQEADTRRKTLEERVETRRNALETGERRPGGFILVEGKPYKFSRYDPEKPTPYVVTDENGKVHQLSTQEINNALKAELELEDKAALENLKPESRVSQIAGRTLEQVSKTAKQLIETAEKNQVGAFLVRQANAFLNKFDYRDKEKGWYAAGIAVGAGTNVALTAFAPFLAHGPGRIVRSAAFSGVLLGVSKGANIFRNMSMNKILSNFGIEDKVEQQNYSSQFDQAFRLLGNGGEKSYHEAMKKISAEIFTKYGSSQTRTDVEGSAATLSSEELQKRIESLSTKYKNLNNGIRSFSAGLSVGTIGATGFFGLEKFVSHAFDKMPHLGIFGGKPNVPSAPRPSTPTPGVPEHTPTPGVPESTPTPEVPDHTPGIPDQTPEPGVPTPETPGLHDILANPDYAHTLEIQQGDTVGSILTNSGYDIDWGSDNAQVFGAHIQANYDMLSNMHDNIAATGMSVEDFPTQAEINTLVAQASAGDPVAMHQLTETMHWIPAGGNFVVLSPEAIELVNNTQGG